MKPSWPRGIHRDLEPLEALIAERGLGLGKPLEIMEEIDSTNDAAKRAAKLGAPSGALFVAESQSRGRGRQGRAWLATKGESILASVLLRVRCEPRKLPPVTLVCGLAVRDAVQRAVGAAANVKLKWPNDVLIGHRKVSGVLVEAIVTAGARAEVEAVVVGFGINVHQRTFPEELLDRATSVSIAAPGVEVDRARILTDVLAGLDQDVAHVAARGLGLVHARITAADALANKRIRTEDGSSGDALGIDLDGTLRLRREDGTVTRLHAGEVHLVT
jgi:BirA family biotin operon repressor/biotin-[acetyl-CoA-carboxylase] ligase